MAYERVLGRSDCSQGYRPSPVAPGSPGRDHEPLLILILLVGIGIPGHGPLVEIAGVVTTLFFVLLTGLPVVLSHTARTSTSAFWQR
jgi:hypothetical protein